MISGKSWTCGAALVVSCALLNCGSTLPEPATGPHPPSEYMEVPYPPPAAAPEVIPPAPRAGLVWIDGQWNWRGRYYVWQRGGWVVPPAGAYFAPWQKYYTADGTLYFVAGAWRRKRDGALIAAPRIEAPASFPATRFTPESVITP